MREEIHRLRKANDKAGFDKATKQLKKVERESKQIKEEVVVGFGERMIAGVEWKGRTVL